MIHIERSPIALVAATNIEIERSAMYTFRARIVDSFQAGRCILAGDSAHLTRECA